MKVKERIGKFVIFITIIVVIYIIVCYLYASWKKDLYNKYYGPNSMPTDYVIQWKDKNLEVAIRNRIKKDKGDIWLSDIWSATYLDLSDYDIENIDNLAEFKNIEFLKLNDNNIEDIEPLHQLIL